MMCACQIAQLALPCCCFTERLLTWYLAAGAGTAEASEQSKEPAAQQASNSAPGPLEEAIEEQPADEVEAEGDGSSSSEDGDGEGGSEGEVDDDLQICWEVLEEARNLCMKVGCCQCRLAHHTALSAASSVGAQFGP